jgi:hypothetical protein
LLFLSNKTEDDVEFSALTGRLIRCLKQYSLRQNDNIFLGINSIRLLE